MEDDSWQSSLTQILSDLNIFQYFHWDGAMLPAVLIMLLLIWLSALVSGSEVAFFSLSPKQIHELDLKHKKAYRIDQFLKHPERLLGTILLGNNLFNVAFIMSSYFVIGKLFDFEGNTTIEWVFQAVIITSFLVLFGEIIPKTYATKRNLQMAFGTVNLLTLMYFLTSPLVKLLNKSSDLIQNRLRKKDSSMTSEDIDKAIELSVGTSETEENKNILKGIVKFGNITVKQIMQSRVDVVAADESLNYGELLNIVTSSGYSRIPIYKESFDNVTGILYAKDLLAHMEQPPEFKWQQLLRQAFYVPETKKISDLLEEFRQKRIHLAIVVDEYGGASGLITLEDVLEEVIGEIIDEFDDEAEIQYKKIDEATFLFQGKTQLNDVCRVVGLPTDAFNNYKGDADTLAGLILEINGTLPKSGDLITIDNYSFRIITVNNIRIVRVQLTIHNKVDEAA
ncbi:MAG: gliding motility-associated protein GldE [Bacteroidetes bacterium]|nr:gliding motility-associated protein GldE [Bacteroidota bacterium]